MIEEPLEQPGENHRVGDVGDEEFVEAQHAAFFRDALRDNIEGSLLILQRVQLRVNLVHEAVKVAAPALGEGQALIEEIHEPGLAPADAAPEIQPLLQRGGVAELRDQPRNDGRVSFVSIDQALAQIVQPSHDRKLRAISSEPSRRDQSIVLGAQTQNASSGKSRK